MKDKFIISHYKFDSELEKEIIQNHREYLSWPLVYFLNDENSKHAYVGETTDVIKRMKAHSKTENKKDLTSVNLILSEYFNKSATLDVEANLIRYINADGQYNLKNANLGIANHRFYQQKEVYWELFSDIWNELIAMGIARHSLDYIDNSDLFKYSPYKSLSPEQVVSLKTILECLLDDTTNVSLIQGGAGTGKSILAIFLFKLLKTNLDDFNFSDFDEEDLELFELLKAVRVRYGELNMALVIPMASFRKTISKVFKNIQGLSPKMVIGPSELAKQKYDLVIVDEGHRLRRRVNLGPYFKPFDDTCSIFGLDKMTASELDWVLIQSKKALIFYDRYQSIKPSDVLRERYIALENNPSTRLETLKTQFRCRGGNDYIKFIHNLLDNEMNQATKFQSLDYECYLFNNLQNMVDEIHKRERIDGLSRLVAGYAWEWVSNKDKNAYDIEIENTKLRWNSVSIDWVNTTNSINEVGCIHTTQGYDLNYTGVIIGTEIDYDFDKQELVIYKERYKDKAGKNTINDVAVLKEYILNIYKTILLRGVKGTFIYACNENLRKYLGQFLTVKDEEKLTPKLKILDTPNEKTIPLYDLKIAAGSFSEQQNVENIRYVELERPITNRSNYFACKVVGESMNKVIPNGSICLFEKYNGGSRNGLITLVELTDYTDSESGSNYTIKEYSSKKTADEDGWKHEEIILLPKSTLSFESIILKDEQAVGLKVVGIFVCVIE
ncbi:MAG: DNA/RNA helicase domain-containing protein [Flavobacteriales bacterium]